MYLPIETVILSVNLSFIGLQNANMLLWVLKKVQLFKNLLPDEWTLFDCCNICTKH